jgi:hypothetical protein
LWFGQWYEGNRLRFHNLLDLTAKELTPGGRFEALAPEGLPGPDKNPDSVHSKQVMPANYFADVPPSQSQKHEE